MNIPLIIWYAIGGVLGLLIAGIIIFLASKKDWQKDLDDDRDKSEGNRIELD